MDGDVDAGSRPPLLAPRDQPAVAALLLVWLAVTAGRLILWAAGPGLARYDQPRPQPHLVVKVNFAEAPELSLLPGIGPTLAQRMIEHRRRQGPFRTPEDLLLVRGIGPKTLQKMRPHVDCATELRGAPGAF